ncbi:MAG: type II toxin-antitoxin system HicB family antitoxin [Pyrinomonadaceae bacterium]
MRYMVVIEEGAGDFGAYVPDLPGCVAVGETEDEVKQLIQEAVEFHLEDLAETGVKIPKPLSKSE